MRISLIIAAGGSGSRFKTGLRHQSKQLAEKPATKLFYSLAGKPLLLRTILAFQNVPEVKETVLALPPRVDSIVQGWIKDYALKGIRCVRGGQTRAESVQLAIRRSSPRQNWVMIHDGARPLICPKQVSRLTSEAKNKNWQACLLAKKVVPTIKQAAARADLVKATVCRDRLFEAETPQLFQRRALMNAYRLFKKSNHAPTDEASLLEAQGTPIHLVPHETWNPKITSPADLELAESYLIRSQGMQSRVGLGSDTHRLIEGRPFWLGGILLKWPYGPLGHSDGDALLHAVMDALLGAASLGDIGELFSDQDPKHKNRSSADMLSVVLKRLQKSGWKAAQVDCTVQLERPRLGLSKKAMVKKIASLLGLEEKFVSVKAKSFEGDGTGGAGLLIRCDALAVIQRS